MEQTSFFSRVWAAFLKRKILWSCVIIVVLLILFLIFRGKSGSANIQTGTVTRQDIQKTVLTTGQVVSETDLDLSFQGTGVLRRLNVKEGDQVYAGQVLAVLDQSQLGASVESAEAALAQAQANYNKIAAAATAQDIAVSQASVDAAQTTLQNAKQNLLTQLSNAYTTANTAVLSDTNSLFSNPQTNNPQFSVPGTIQTNQQLVGHVNDERSVVNTTLNTWQGEIASLSDANTDQVVASSLAHLSQISAYFADVISLLSSYTQVTSGGSQTTLNTYISTVAAGKASIDGLVTTLNTNTQAVKTAASSLAQARASLALKQAPARPEDLDIAKAQMISAQASVDLAKANLSNTVLVAPANGTITQVDIKLGEQAQALKEVMKLQNVGDLHAEALVSEADIAAVAPGQTIDNTFDALGPNQHFQSTVLTVNPSSTVVSGVVDYKVIGSLDKISGVKPGMTDNMTILVASTSQALVVPSSSVVNDAGKQYVKVIDDVKKKTYHQVEVTTGLQADGGLTQILSGLDEGQTIVTYMK